MTKHSLLLCLITVLVLSSSIAFAQSGYSSDIEILNSDDNGITFRYNTPELKSEKINSDKNSFDRVDIDGCVILEKSGEPRLPAKIVVLAVPLGSTVEAVVADVQTEKYNLNIAPVPQVEKDENSELGYKYSYSAFSGIYAKDIPFPENITRVDPTEFVRNQRIVKIMLFPVQFNPKTKTVQFHSSITVQVNFIGGEKGKTNLTAKDPFEYIYRKSLLNYEQAKIWRRTRTQKTFKPKSDPFDYSDNWYKIRLKEDGLYCLTRSDLSNAGITGNIDIDKIRMFNGGGRRLPLSIDSMDFVVKEIPLWIRDKNSNGYFDSNDSLLFYGWWCNGWDYDSTKKRFGYFLHPYDSVNVFWLNFEGGFPDLPKRMEEKDGSLQGQPSIIPYKTVNREHIESNKTLKISTEGEILSYQIWYWIKTNLFAATRSLPGLLVGETHNVNVKASASVISLLVNGSLADKYAMEIVDGDEIGRFRSSAFTSSTLQELSMSFSTSIYFDWYEIEYWRTLELTNNQLLFESPDTNGLVEYHIAGAKDTLVFDVSDRFDPKRIVGASVIKDTLIFQDNVISDEKLQYYALSKERMKKPISIYADQPSHLKSSTNQADVIIIGPEVFSDQIASLAVFRRIYNGFSVETAKLQDIYDEFSGGLADPTAIRNFLKYAFQNWSQPAPAFVLLAGDGNYDHKNYSGTNDTIRVPCFTAQGSLVTDEFYVYFGSFGDLDSDDNGEVDMIISRLPVKSPDEMEGVLQKIINYEQSPDFGPWRNRVTLVADDEFGGEGNSQETRHTEDSEILAETYIPQVFDVSKIYMVEYPFNSVREKPGATDAIIDAFDRGTLIMNYMGHGNPDLWAHEHVFTTADIPKLNSNNAKVPLVFAATCEVGYFMDPTKQSLGERLFNAYNKGASSVIAATSPVTPTGNFELDLKFFNEILGEDRPVVGEALFIAKLLCTADTDDRPYVLFGDPVARVGWPKLPVNMQVSPDTLSALRLVVVSGQVSDTSGNPKSDFSGTVNITAYDSKRAKSHPVVGDGTLNYNLPGRTLFRGTAEIEHGTFQVQFIVPKDISYGGNTARISAYVFDGQIDGAGSVESLLVSGSDTTTADSIGPQITMTFSGQEDFREEDFIARDAIIEINLFDSSGVNLTGEMGHGITLNIDNSTVETDLTYLFKYDAGSYTTGSFSYQLPGLSEGEHILKIKAWDSANNSTQLVTRAKVRSSSKFEILNLMNYPNPFSEQTSFSYELTEDGHDVRINILTLAGKLVKTIYGASSTVGYNFRTVWDGRDNDGDKVANGVYIYKVEAASFSGAKAEAYGKAVVMH